MNDETKKLVADFVRWCEHDQPTVRIPRAGPIPRDVAELARVLERELAIQDVADTGVHRLEVLHRALLSAKPPSPPPDHRLDSIMHWKRKGVTLLFIVIAALLGVIGTLAKELFDARLDEGAHRAAPAAERK